MRKLHSFYACGFNGFGQLCSLDNQEDSWTTPVDEAAPGNVSLIDKEKESSNIFVMSPKLVSKCIVHGYIKECIFTWSQMWILLVNGAVKCTGFNNEKTAHVGIAKAIVRHRHTDVIVQNIDGITVMQDDGTSHAVKLEHAGTQLNDLEHTGSHLADMANAGIRLIDSDKDYVYGIQDGQLLRGTMSTMDGMKTLLLVPLAENIPVKSVSCGFDHTLILSDNGMVFSYGSTSRGQLGHGEISVDITCTPKKIETLSGMNVIAVASGGWHCAAVTDSGDLYVWGWNESGQLGLPNWSTEFELLDANNRSTKFEPPNANNHSKKFEPPDANNRSTEFESSNANNHSTEFEPLDTKNHTCCSNIDFNPDRATVSYAEYCRIDNTFDTDNFKHVSIKRKCSNTEGFTECTTLTTCATDYASRLLLGLGKHIGNIVSQSKRPHLDESDVGNVWRPLKLDQDLGMIQMQAVPFGLAIPDGVNVKAVACGSRHTCIVTEDGWLMTSGWNAYGQLCHGDTMNRDYFETVTEFMDIGVCVVDVKAGHWNTLIVIEHD